MATEYCNECGNQVVQLTPQEIGKRLKDSHSMYYWGDQVVGTKKSVPGLGEVEVVFNSYHDAYDYDRSEIKIVWSTRHGFVGVTDSYSSYNGSEWDSNFKKAERNVKEVISFE